MNHFKRTLFLGALCLVLGSAISDDGDKKCNRELVESYNLNGYMTQRPMSMYLCPTLKLSCCSLYDQFMMFTTWKDKIKPKLMKYYDGIRKKYVDIKQLLGLMFQIDIPKLVNGLPISEEQKEIIMNRFTLLSTQDYEKMFNDILILHHENYQYMMKLRASFFCVICDFDMQTLINMESKVFRINDGTCQDLASNTIEHSFYLNVKLVQYLTDLGTILHGFALSASDKPPKVRYFNNVKRIVRSCAKAVEIGTNFRPCRNYCRYYKFNSNSPVIEGYQVFFNDVLVALSKFIKNYGSSLNKRVLEDLPGERILFDHSPFPTYTRRDFRNRKDPYDEDTVDPNFDDYVLNSMFNFQEDVETDRVQAYINFVKTKIFNSDTEYDFENGDDNDIFKTSTSLVVDLENFNTRVGSPGIDVFRHADTTNIDNSMKELIINLKNKSRFKIQYEKIDPKLLEQVNNVDNEDVKNFHRDNFMFFRDFSSLLKKEEIVNQIIERQATLPPPPTTGAPLNPNAPLDPNAPPTPTPPPSPGNPPPSPPPKKRSLKDDGLKNVGWRSKH